MRDTRYITSMWEGCNFMMSMIPYLSFHKVPWKKMIHLNVTQLPSAWSLKYLGKSHNMYHFCKCLFFGKFPWHPVPSVTIYIVRWVTSICLFKLNFNSIFINVFNQYIHRFIMVLAWCLLYQISNRKAHSMLRRTCSK